MTEQCSREGIVIYLSILVIYFLSYFQLLFFIFIFSYGVNRPAILQDIPHFGVFPAFLGEYPAFLALFRK